MNNELKEAADRYRADDYFSDDAEGFNHDLKAEDTFLLRDAYLSEHPADDDEPITSEWLDGILSREFDPQSRHWKPTKPEFSLLRLRFDSVCGYVATYGLETLRVVQARGDVRRLCTALGVPLKQPAKPNRHDTRDTLTEAGL